MSLDIYKFNELYRQYQQVVFINILKYIKDETVAEDILQDVFFALWKHRSKLTDMDKVPGWLFVVSSNISISYLKERLRKDLLRFEDHEQLSMRDVLDDTTDALDLAELQWKVLEEAIEDLPKKRKQVFQLCKLEGRSYKDVARMLGISVESVKDYLKKSNRSIRSFISERYRPEDHVLLYPLMVFLAL